MFMHGGWMHIIGNMIYLWAFGPEIEEAMGSFRFLFFYIAGGLIAMMAQVLADPSSSIPVLGASGAIAAVMGAFIVTFPGDHTHRAFLPDFLPGHIHSRGAGHRLLVPDAGAQFRIGGRSEDGRRGLPRSYCRVPVWGCVCAHAGGSAEAGLPQLQLLKAESLFPTRTKAGAN